RGGLVVVGRDIEDLYPRSWKNFSPRLGFTYQPNGRDDLVVRGGLGLFYDTPSISPFLDQASLANNGAIGVEANPAGSKPVYQITRNGYTNAAGFTFQQQTRPYFAQFPNFGVID